MAERIQQHSVWPRGGLASHCHVWMYFPCVSPPACSGPGSGVEFEQLCTVSPVTSSCNLGPAKCGLLRNRSPPAFQWWGRCTAMFFLFSALRAFFAIRVCAGVCVCVCVVVCVLLCVCVCLMYGPSSSFHTQTDIKGIVVLTRWWGRSACHPQFHILTASPAPNSHGHSY